MYFFQPPSFSYSWLAATLFVLQEKDTQHHYVLLAEDTTEIVTVPQMTM
jgi:hypothetical protein